MERTLTEAADSLAKASTPEPFSSSRTSNWVARAGGLPAYIQHIAHDLMEKRGKSESNAIQMAIGIVKNWASGQGKVDENTRAAARKAVAQWEAMKGKAKLKEASARARVERAERVLGRGAAERVALGRTGAPPALARELADALAVIELCEADSSGDGTAAQGSPGKCASCGKRMPKNVKANRTKCPFCGGKVQAQDKKDG